VRENGVWRSKSRVVGLENGVFGGEN